MKKTLKLFSVLTIITLLVTMFAGCGKSADKVEGDSSTLTTQSTQQSTDGKPDMTEKFKFTMAAKGSNTVDNDSKYIKAMEDKYNFDIDVLPCYGDEYSNQVKMLLSSGQVPDVIRLDEGLQMADLVNQDLLAQITMDELNT